MAYTRPTNLKTPLQSVMKWEGKRSIAEIINTDLRFQKTTLQGSNNNSSQITVTVYFAWKPDSLQAAAEQEIQEEDIPASKRAKKGKRSKVERRIPSPGSPEMRKRPGGVRTRRQAQLEEDGEVQGPQLEEQDGEAEAKVAVKKEEVEDAGWDLPDSPTPPTVKQLLME